MFSELGDKTFFIALLLSLNKPKGAVFAGTFGALALMSVISVRAASTLHELQFLALEKSGMANVDMCHLLILKTTC